VVSGTVARRLKVGPGGWRGIIGVAAALLAGASLSCVRYAQYHRLSAPTGTCDGACRHYVGCKEDESAGAFSSCVDDCREIFVHEGEPDRDSLRVFEGLECKAAVAFVDGDDEGRDHTATSTPRRKGRSQAH
jgi:hypothetical protein